MVFKVFRRLIATAPETLYSNKVSFTRRMELYHCFRLKQQLKLDKENLESLRKPWVPPTESTILFKYHVKTPLAPGADSYDPKSSKVDVYAKLEALNCNHEAAKVIIGHKRLRDGQMCFSINRYPAVALNKSEALEIIRNLEIAANVNKDITEKGLA